VSYRTILLHLDNGTDNDRRIDAAVQLAVAHDAHLIALHAPAPLYLQWSPETGLRDELAARRRQEDDARAEQAFSRFEAAAAKAGLGKREVRQGRGEPRELLSLHARYADLVVMGQADPKADGSREAASIVEDVILSCGRPVLLVPYVGLLQPIGRHVLVAWDASREAARAVSDALPLIEKAAKVSVVSVDAKPSATGHGQLPGADLGLFLARHRIEVQVDHLTSAGISVGDVLLNHASDRNADLIVMGCYGHTRLRELVLGGATRTLLQTTPVPLLMAH
jgi:nucleotide-binding universal stress UspA family protein